MIVQEDVIFKAPQQSFFYSSWWYLETRMNCSASSMMCKSTLLSTPYLSASPTRESHDRKFKNWFTANQNTWRLQRGREKPSTGPLWRMNHNINLQYCKITYDFHEMNLRNILSNCKGFSHFCSFDKGDHISSSYVKKKVWLFPYLMFKKNSMWPSMFKHNQAEPLGKISNSIEKYKSWTGHYAQICENSNNLCKPELGHGGPWLPCMQWKSQLLLLPATNLVSEESCWRSRDFLHYHVEYPENASSYILKQNIKST